MYTNNFETLNPGFKDNMFHIKNVYMLSLMTLRKKKKRTCRGIRTLVPLGAWQGTIRSAKNVCGLGNQNGDKRSFIRESVMKLQHALSLGCIVWLYQSKLINTVLIYLK